MSEKQGESMWGSAGARLSTLMGGSVTSGQGIRKYQEVDH